MQGQINFEDNKLGQRIVDLVKLKEISTIVEIGTWNGLGTTRCVLHGLKQSNKADYLFISVECNKTMYIEALKNNANNICDNIIFKLGRLVEAQEIDSWFDISTLSQEQQSWLAQDKIWLNEVPCILNDLPDKIDLLILDGGEFSTYLEWRLLKDRVKYVALDDTMVLKCSRIRNEVLNDKNFEIY